MTYNKKEVQPQWVDGDIMVQPKKLYRIDGSNGRYYQDENGKSAPSATTITGEATPYGLKKDLVRWYSSIGLREAEAISENAADRGTLGHVVIGYAAEKGGLEVGNPADTLTHFYRTIELGDDYDPDDANRLEIYPPAEWEADLMKQIWACMQFMIDYDVKPIGLEVTLMHPDGFAGTVDMICTMLVNPASQSAFNKMQRSAKKFDGTFEEWRAEILKGQRKTGIVDWKFGKSLYPTSHAPQLFCYKRLVEFNYPNIEIEFLHNVRPKKWRSTKTKNFTYEVSQNYMEDGKDYFETSFYYEKTWELALAVFKHHWPDFVANRKAVNQFKGKVDLSDPQSLKEAYQFDPE